MTKRDYLLAKKNIKRNKKSHIKQRNNISASDTAYGKELEAKAISKQIDKQNKVIEKQNKKL